SLVVALYKHADWTLIFSDGTETLFCARWACPREAALDLSATSVVTRIVAQVKRDLAPHPGATEQGLLHLSRLLVEVNALARAEALLASMEQGIAVWTVRALVAQKRGQRADARMFALRVVKADQRAISALALLARMALADGDGPLARRWLARWLEQDPFSAEARRLLGELCAPRR
ncbi:MAG: hypothetical protein JRH20_25870, partial [Deltaproteobacteria bacterium]|nr:hypothetical protein [Deltaproteobacteria bacterium]